MQHHSALSTWARHLAPDALALAGVCSAVVAIVCYILWLPPTTFSTTIAEPANGVGLYYFYGVERNATGPYRWSRPQAQILIPLNRPGAYRVTVSLQDNPALGQPRTVKLRIAGQGERTIQLTDTLRDYTIEGAIDETAWHKDNQRLFDLQLATTAAFAPGDARPLGVIVGRVAVEPVGATAYWNPALVALYLGLLLALYGSVRLLGATPVRTAIGVGALLGLVALFAIVARARAFPLISFPLFQPIVLLGLALLAVPLPLVRWSWGGAGATLSPATAAAAPDRRLWSRRSLPLLPLVLVALGTRLYGLDRLSLWLDEGFTALYARLPWDQLFGLQGQYDVHPPLYYAAVKVVALIAPDAVAGRLVSALAGALTIPILYLLVVRLADRSTALAAATILTFSPLHIWYSQEARMYALATLFVALSYLALAYFAERGSYWWAAGYGTLILLALYTDFSVVFALAPQLFLLIFLGRRLRWRSLAVWLAGAIATALFLPWLYAATVSVNSTANNQAWFLGVSVSKIAESLLAIGGFSGNSSYYWLPALSPWLRWPALRGAILLLVGIAVVIGALALLRRRSATAIVAAALLIGTIGTATLVSAISPGYADRTILYSTLGWAILIGAAPFVWSSRALRLAGTVGFVGVLVLSGLTYGAVARDAQKQDYRALARETARVATPTTPAFTDSALTATFLDLYAPQLATVQVLAFDEARTRTKIAPYDMLWFAYADYSTSEGENIAAHFAALGYERMTRTSFSRPFARDSLFLDLYARRGATIAPGRAVSCDCHGVAHLDAAPISIPTALLWREMATVAGSPRQIAG